MSLRKVKIFKFAYTLSISNRYYLKGVFQQRLVLNKKSYRPRLFHSQSFSDCTGDWYATNDLDGTMTRVQKALSANQAFYIICISNSMMYFSFLALLCKYIKINRHNLTITILSCCTTSSWLCLLCSIWGLVTSLHCLTKIKMIQHQHRIESKLYLKGHYWFLKSLLNWKSYIIYLSLSRYDNT